MENKILFEMLTEFFRGLPQDDFEDLALTLIKAIMCQLKEYEKSKPERKLFLVKN